MTPAALALLLTLYALGCCLLVCTAVYISPIERYQ